MEYLLRVMLPRHDLVQEVQVVYLLMLEVKEVREASCNPPPLPVTTVGK